MSSYYNHETHNVEYDSGLAKRRERRGARLRRIRQEGPIYCERPDDCVNGPARHEYKPDTGEDTYENLPCFKQSWEK